MSTCTSFAAAPSCRASARPGGRLRHLRCAAAQLPALGTPTGVSQPPAREVRLVATSAAHATQVPPPTRLQQFGRATWPFFALLEAVALVGCVVNGISSRKRRVELVQLNEKLRALVAKLAAVEQSDAAADAYTPAGEATAKGKRALAAGSFADAAAAFTQACQLSVSATDAEAELAALKGLAAAQLRQGFSAAALSTLLRALEVSKPMSASGVGDAAVLGSLGDVYAEMGDLEKAGTAYDEYMTAME